MLMEITECFNDRHYQDDTSLYVKKITVEAGKVTIAFNCISGDDREVVIASHMRRLCYGDRMDCGIFENFKGSAGRSLGYKQGFEIVVPTQDPNDVIQKMWRADLISIKQRDACTDQIVQFVP